MCPKLRQQSSKEGVIGIHLQSLPWFYATQGRDLASFSLFSDLTFVNPQLMLKAISSAINFTATVSVQPPHNAAPHCSRCNNPLFVIPTNLSLLCLSRLLPFLEQLLRNTVPSHIRAWKPIATFSAQIHVHLFMFLNRISRKERTRFWVSYHSSGTISLQIIFALAEFGFVSTYTVNCKLMNLYWQRKMFLLLQTTAFTSKQDF